MSVIVVGDTDSASTLASGAGNGVAWSAGGAGEPGTVAALAEALVAFEAAAATGEVDAIVLADDSDASLAAALVGTKLPTRVSAVDDAMSAESVNGRLIAQLADAYTRPR
jgi:hypothetical protein